MLGSGHNNTSLIISNDEMDGILKIVKPLEDSGVLLKGVSETIQHEAIEQRGGFLSMLLGTLGASLLGDILSKGLSGKGLIRAGEGTIRAGYGFKKFSLNNNKTVTYFDSFGVEHIPNYEIMGNKKIITNIYRIQAYDSIMRGYFCIGFINFMFNGNSLTDYTSLFSPNDLKKTMI